MRGKRAAPALLAEIEGFERAVWRILREADCSYEAVESALQGWGEGLDAPMPSSAQYVAPWHAVHALKAVRDVRAAIDAATSDDEADRIAGYIRLGQGYREGVTGVYFPELRGRLAGLAGRGKQGHRGPLYNTLEIIFEGGVPRTNAEAFARLKELGAPSSDEDRDDDEDPGRTEMDDLFESLHRPSPWRVLVVEDEARQIVFRDHAGKEHVATYKTIENTLSKLRSNAG